jgi:amino acid adenylation domain-containing protein
MSAYTDAVNGWQLASESLTYPASFAQQRLWFLDKLEPGKSVYNVSEALRLKGQLDCDALARSVSEIVRRHDSLRTTFAEIDGSPIQVVAPSVAIEIPIENLAHLPAAEREPEAARLAGNRANQPYNLQQGPLIRVSLLQLAGDEHVLLIGMHHIISEGGWSMSIFLRELNALYNADVGHGTPALPELPIQYGDYVVWQRDWMQGDVRDQLLSYWSKQLTTAPPLLDLPLDRTRPSQQSYAGDRESHLLPAPLITALSTFSKAEGATLFMSLLAAFNTLLHRYSRQDEVVIGVGAAGRGSPETHDLIGFFVNTLALRTDVSDDPSFRELVRRTRQTCADAYDHEDLPFELLVEALKPERSLAYSPVFQVMFSYQNVPRGDLHLTGLEVSPFHFDIRTSMFDMTLFAWERPEGVLLNMEYSTDLFERTTIQKLLRHFEILLAGAVRSPETPISQLPLLDDSERQRILVEWNNTDAEFPGGRCVHELFEEQVRKAPHAPAVVLGDAVLSYAGLNRRANQLAHYLRRLGVGPDQQVAVCLERGFELIVAVLAILKAGGAYVPLDPSYPGERLRYMLEDSAPVALLTRGPLQRLFRGLSEALPVLDVAAASSSWGGEPETDVDPSAFGLTPVHLAYVIYTSGSTGAPKGVMVPHRAINRLVLNNGYAKFEARDRVAFASNPAFDATTMEVWAPLLNGGCIVVIEQDVVLDPARLGQGLRRHAVSILWLTVGLFNQYSETLSEEFGKLRYLIVGGDALDPRVIARLLRNHPPQHLINGYGPTETTTFAVTHEVTVVPENARSIPIGRPIANTRVYILDARGEPVPEGVPGELYIGGAGVARGYLKRPELTAERFLPDPFAADVTARMYKTGDLGRWLPDGTIEFLGRNDFQVKLRGFRIELGEIEARIAEQHGVREAVVLAREDTPGDKRLVAYYTGDQDVALGAETLRAHLSGQLPEYMVPAAYVRMKSLPLTRNGKVDRKALPQPEVNAYAVAGYEAPRGEVEGVLADLWAKLLKLDRVGRNDDYFALGGHSLLAVQLFSQIEKHFGIDLPLATLYKAPTIELLARIVSEGGRSDLEASLVPINATGRKPPLYCASGIGGGVLVFRDLAVKLGPDQPFYGLQPKREGGKNVPVIKLAEIASGYIQAIQQIQPCGPYYLSGYSFGGLVAFEMAQQLVRAGFTVAFLGLFDTTAPVRVKTSRTDLFPRRTYGTTWQRTLEIVCSGDAFGKIRDIIRRRKFWAQERLARALKLSLPAELETLKGSQGFAALNYVGEPYAGPITLFRSQLRPANELWSRTLGWEQVASEIEVHDIPGDHLSIYSGDNIGPLASMLESCLERAPTKANQVPSRGI